MENYFALYTMQINLTNLFLFSDGALLRNSSLLHPESVSQVLQLDLGANDFR
jgi:hypothetical protein